LLKNLHVSFVDLGNTVLENFRGKLAVIGPFGSNSVEPSISTPQIKRLSNNGVGVVWVQPMAQNLHSGEEMPRPSFYSVAANQVTTVVVQPQLIANLPGNPRAQLNLIYFCKIALRANPPALPEVSLLRN
jgi:hypothetical protein